MVLSHASEYLKELMHLSEIDKDLPEIVIIVPDFSAYDLSDFLLSLYGGALPADTTAVQQLVDLFRMRLPKQKSSVDIRHVFGQICSEIEQVPDF
jgi:hypothetical protein